MTLFLVVHLAFLFVLGLIFGGVMGLAIWLVFLLNLLYSLEIV